MRKKTLLTWFVSLSFAFVFTACGNSTTEEKTPQDGGVSSEKNSDEGNLKEPSHNTGDGGVKDTSPKEGPFVDQSDGASTAPIGNISGAWTIKDTPTSNCDEDQVSTWNAKIIQNGSQIELQATDCSLKGTLHGNKLSITGSCTEEGGTTTFSSFVLTVDPSLTKMTGTSKWEWSDQSESCQGTSVLEATK